MIKCGIQAMSSKLEGFSLQEQEKKKADKLHTNACQLRCPPVLVLIAM